MLTIKQITEDTDKVIRGLEKKHFANAKETIAKVLELNDQRRSAQNQLDKNLSEVNSTSKAIGALMKEGKRKRQKLLKLVLLKSKKLAKNCRQQWIRLQKICRTCFIPSLMYLTKVFRKVSELKIMW